MSSCRGQKGKLRIELELKGADQAQFFIYSIDGGSDKIDTLKLQNGRLRYQCDLSGDATYRLVFSSNQYLTIWGHSGDALTLKGSVQDLKHIKVKGNDENNLYTKFRLSVADLKDASAIRKKASEFIKDNASSPVAVEVFERYFFTEAGYQTNSNNGGGSSASGNPANQSTSTTNESVGNDSEGKSLLKVLLKEQPNSSRLVAFDNAYKRREGLSVGHAMTDFDLIDLDSIHHRLSDYRGRYLLMLFWASWQVQDNMFYKARNACQDLVGDRLSVLCVSLDVDRNLLNNGGLRDTNGWPVTCDFKAWTSPFIQKLGLRTLPYAILVDPDGRIAARGSNFEREVQPAMQNIR